MSTVRCAALVVTALLLAPTALASAGLTASMLVLSGDMTLDGDASALFFLLDDPRAITWDLTAAGGRLVRDHLVETAVDHPLNGGAYLLSRETDAGHEEIDLGPLHASSRGGQTQGALLARGTLAASATSGGFVRIASVSDPTVSQFGPSDVRSGEGVGIEETLPGEHLEVELTDGTLTLRGDLVLDIFGPWYALEEGGETREMQTGESETMRAGPAAEVRTERHELTLVDAVLHVRALQPIQLYTRYPTVALSGTLEATGGEGAIAAMDAGEDGAWRGTTRLALAPQGGLVAARAPAAAVASTVLAPAPLPAAVTLALLLAALAVGGAALLARRRARADDLELALLAMSERRWNDALPHLTRVARRQPDNASVHIDRALCLEQVGRFEEAAKAFESALRLAPRHAEAHYYYARTLARMQEKEAARSHLETALERDPRLAEMMRGEAVLKGL